MFNIFVKLLTKELTLAPFATTSLKANFTSFNLTPCQFSNLQLQALSNQRAYFNYKQLGYISLNCLLKTKELVV